MRHSKIDSDGGNRSSSLSLNWSLEKEPTRTTARWSIFLKNLRVVALPRYLQPGGLRRRKKTLLPSSYLDSLRGYAALFVVNRHRFDLSKTWLAQQPIIRVIHCGDGAVSIFFIISGYVLSYRLLMLMRNKETERLLDSLASSTLRRYLRLYGSVCVATFMSMLMIWFNLIRPYKTDRKDTFRLQLRDWFEDFVNFSNPFTNLEQVWFQDIFCARYLYPTWTIPLEFRASMVVFAFCTAVCKLSTKNRMILTLVTIALCYYWKAIYIALFLEGMFIADLSFERDPQRLKGDVQLPEHEDKPKASSPVQSVAARVGYVMMVIVALLFLGAPYEEDTIDHFPWQYLRQTIPQWDIDLRIHFWLSVGAFMLIFALESYPALRKPLTSNFSLYLGELSFGIYLMHQFVMWGLYERVLDPMRELYLGDSYWARTAAMLIYYPAVLWAAEQFMRIDNGVVRLGRHIQSVTFLKWGE